jgi:hypothetical protein
MPSTTYTGTGTWHKFNVPANVDWIEVDLRGGGSGGRNAGKVTGRISVKGNDVLWCRIGEAGKAASGKNGGGVADGGGGAGGDGSSGKNGGRGGGGASVIRLNGSDGRILAVAGGAGGNSGDTGNGGIGGGNIGHEGGRGTAGTGDTANSTGGTQNQPGHGGTSEMGTAYYGKDANEGRLARGGRGGGTNVADRADMHGGGGGGGGFYAGGGGQAAKIGETPGGGGAGGSNFTGGMYSDTNEQGAGGGGDGQAILTWLNPEDAPPRPPQNIRIDGAPIADGLPTKAKHNVTVKGTPADPDAKGVRMFIQMSKDNDFTTNSVWKGTYDESEDRDIVEITGLEMDTLYHLHIYSQDTHGRLSPNFTSTTFWTNRSPSVPNLTAPVENAQFTTLINPTFTWNHVDPDPSDSQTAFRLRYRRSSTPLEDAGEWTELAEQVTASETWTADAGTFKGNTSYDWQVKTRDEQDAWGPWAIARSFLVTAEATPPVLTSPIKGAAIVASEDTTFRWKFRPAVQGDVQEKADIRYRPALVGGAWTTLAGDGTTPGSDPFWVVDGDTFGTTYYEWQARTYVSGSAISDWSDSAYFWATATPGTGPGVAIVASGSPQHPLGQGDNRAFVYDRGGMTMRGEITNLAYISWGRKRDDISNVILRVNEWDEEGKEFLGSLRSWLHEIVVFRDGKRVWEGPITRIGASRSQVEIEAKDVLGYVYRRIMRQGYNDSYRIVDGQQTGQTTVVMRARQIILNALAYSDPNVLQYLTAIDNVGDARQSRVVKDYTKTSWEEIDDLAATAGLDYSTSGRRIMLWDTHRPVGRLPAMTDGDFGDDLIVTEYGMSAANYFAVTNNDGIWGAADRFGVDNMPGEEGFIEQLASSYGENATEGATQTLTRAAKRELERRLAQQADRNISGRWPVPLVVRVPDNTTLSPDLNLGINQLVPGVWIPLRSTETIREVSQWQKLDSVSVIQDAEGEKISVVMSPAPNQGEDPDAEQAATEEG